MNNPTALATLVTLSTKESEAAAISLGKAIVAREDAHQRLTMLHQLRAEYAQKLQAHMVAGVTFAACQNFQRFLLKIDDAIAGQAAIEAAAATQAELSRQYWQAKQREGQTWELLVERADRDAQRKAATQERKANDEFAARAALKRADTETH
ncbi:MAG: hypothetical protein RL404_1028 [Pseudomonadota bacterium]|jgi:flagellar export protein FliJ